MDSKNYDVSLDFLWRDTRTSGYNNCGTGDAPGTDNKGRTMTVKDLISELEKLNPSAPIVVNYLQLKQKASFQGITTLIFYFIGYSTNHSIEKIYFHILHRHNFLLFQE